MVNEIEVTLRGHVGHEPQLLQRAGKQAFLRLNVASTPRVRSRAGEWGDGATQWFAVKTFGDFAKHVALSVRKGDAVLVRGRLEHEEYETRDGESRWTAVIVADAFGPDLRNATAHVSRAVRHLDAGSGEGQPSTPQAGESGAPSAGSEENEATTGAGTDTAEGERVESGAVAEEAGVDLSGFQVLSEEETGEEAEETIAERMSA